MLRRMGWQRQDVGQEVLLLEPTLPDVDAGNYIAAVEAASGADEEESAEELAFELEHQLRDFLIANLVSIPVNGKRLALFQDAKGRNGREYPTDVGFIDALATDDAGALYVFELKRGRTSDQTVGQVLRYMGWCQAHIAKGRPVYGIIVAQSHDEKLKFAASVVPGLYTFEYAISFNLRLTSIG